MKNTMEYLLFDIAALSLLVGCEHKELCYDHSHTASLQVVFDWRQAPKADPASMSLYLFPKSGSEVLRYEFIGREGGRISAPVDSYDAVCLNSDTEGIIYRHTEHFETFEVSTQTTDLLTPELTGLGVRSDTAPRAEGTEGERVALPADMLWSGQLREIALAETDAESTITLAPAVSICRYRIEITGAENLKYVKGLSAALSGMAGGMLLGMGMTSTEHVTHPFEMRAAGDDAAVEGELLVFGHCPDMEREHALIVYAILADGSKFAYTYDAAEVTRQIHEAVNQRDVLIRLDGLPLPKPIDNGGGFQPSVEDWDRVDIGIEM